MLFTLVLVEHGLLSGHKFFADRVLFQGIAYRHLPFWHFLPTTLNRRLPASCDQPEGNIDQNGNYYYA